MALLIAGRFRLCPTRSTPTRRRSLVASAVAWGAAAIVDWFAYMRLYDRPWMQRTTGSNIPSSAVDSLVFPWLAFGGLNIALTLAQFVAKVGGGLVVGLRLEGIDVQLLVTTSNNRLLQMRDTASGRRATDAASACATSIDQDD